MSGKKKSVQADQAAMSPQSFRRWRKSLHLSQKEAAAALGLKRRILQYYEKGLRDGEPVGVPKAVRLACYALAQGCTDYHGPNGADGGAKTAGSDDSAETAEANEANPESGSDALEA